jgi:(1->4)-alpha-D-glucan 1-alpha-D-glucosylmutase
MKHPQSTYRLQFKKDFGFKEAAAIVPYLAQLGISHVYCSPYLKARPGSTHGYDIVDHQSLNPELGSQDDYDHFIQVLKKHSMGQVLDIVPNHMGVGGSDNAIWLDVLENGEASKYAFFFDIDWRPAKLELRGKILLPFLGKPYGNALVDGDLQLRLESGACSVYFAEHRFPVDPSTYPAILNFNLQALQEELKEDDPDFLEYQSLISAFSHLPKRHEKSVEKIKERDRDKEIHKNRLGALIQRNTTIAQHLEKVITTFKGQPGHPETFDYFHQLLESQAWRLSFWKTAADEINYRRFFDVNELAGVRMEIEEVFTQTHPLILDLVKKDAVDGLRIDHPDGLYHPKEYFTRLQQAIATENKAKEPFFVIVEKILAPDESLREDWPVAGTTGYEFLNLLNGLFVDPRAEKILTQIYHRFIRDEMDFEDLIYTCKKQVIRTMLTSEVNMLTNLINQITETDWYARDFTYTRLREALTEIIASFPVYRTYFAKDETTPLDIRYVRDAVKKAKKRAVALETSIFDFIEAVLLGEWSQTKSKAVQDVCLHFTMKFQQVTAPVTAKALEDTSFYRYNRFVSLNEVGGEPTIFGTSLEKFHQANLERLQKFPHSLLGTSTHDTKRSEDVRARLNVLSEMPTTWQKRVRSWQRLNRDKKEHYDRRKAPFANDEYLFYQNLVGVWQDHEKDALPERMKTYMLKAVREAKSVTSWIHPDEDYENALLHFIDHCFLDNEFLEDVASFVKSLDYFSRFNVWSQTLIKMTAPGVPDFYQGAELLHFALVDPDNRRPVDYGLRQKMLESIIKEKKIPRVDEINQSKLTLIYRVLQYRHANASLFAQGAYQAIDSRDELIAFARTTGKKAAVVLAPRFAYTLCQGKETLPVGDFWGDENILLPFAPKTVQNVLTGKSVRFTLEKDTAMLALSDVFADFCPALLDIEL